jgi:hypothetical protein
LVVLRNLATGTAHQMAEPARRARLDRNARRMRDRDGHDGWVVEEVPADRPDLFVTREPGIAYQAGRLVSRPVRPLHRRGR